MNNITAVSYTHLDVYKRQEDGLQEEVEKLRAEVKRRPSAIMMCAATVSYTHLDVYKRQVHYSRCVNIFLTLYLPFQ